MKNVLLGILSMLYMFGCTDSATIEFVQPEFKVTRGHQYHVSASVFSPNGNYALSVDYLSNFIYWDLTTGKPITNFTYSCSNTSSSHTTYMSISADNKFALLSCDSNLVYLDLLKGKELLQLKSASNIKSTAFINDLYAISGHENGTINLWDLELGKNIHTLQGHTKSVNSIVVSRNSKNMISGGSDGCVKIWDLSSKQPIKTFFKDSIEISSIGFSSNEKVLYVGRKDRSMIHWDLESGREILYLESPPVPQPDFEIFAFSPNGYELLQKNDTVANGFGSILYWDSQKSKEKHQFVSNNLLREVSSVSISPNGDYAMIGAYQKLIYWQLKTNKLIKILEDYSSEVLSVAFTPDGKQMISAGGNYFSFENNIGDLKHWDLSLGNIMKPFLGHTSRVSSLSISPNGKYIVSMGDYDGLKLFDIMSGTVKMENSNCVADLPALAFTPDGKYILVNSTEKENHILKLLEITSGKTIRSFKGHKGRVTSLAISSDGKYAVSGSLDRELFVWNIISGEKEINLHSKDDIYAVAISANGIYIAYGGDIKTNIWDLNLKKNIKTIINSPYERITTLAFNPHNNYLLLGDKVMSYWDIERDIKIFDLLGHTSHINDIDISPDGRRALSSSEDKTIKYWDLGKGDEICTFTSKSGDSKKSITTIKNGYYMATKDGINDLVYYVIKNKSYPFDQFDLQYNRPDIVLEKIGLAPRELIDTYKKAYKKRLKKLGFDSTNFDRNRNFNAPEIKIKNKINYYGQTDKATLALDLQATDKLFKLDRLNVYINGVPVWGVKGKDLKTKDSQNFNEKLMLTLSNGKNMVEISALNVKGVESLKERFEIEYVPPQVSKATLHLVTIGVSTYKNNLYNLKYATKDGEDLAKLFKNQRGIYQELIHYSLFDKDVTVTNITQIKKKLQKTNIDDAVIVFISGHGLLDSELDYYLATYDVNFTNPKENGLLYDDLENLLDGIPARKKILLIDACHSGELDKEDLEQLVKDNTQKVESAIVFKNVGNKELKTKTVGLQNSFELMRQTFSDLRKGTGTTVLSAAGGIEAALESNQWKNGAFTYCLLIGLSEQKADLNKDGEVMLLELQQYLFDEVPKITNGKQQPTSRIENLINDWRVW